MWARAFPAETPAAHLAPKYGEAMLEELTPGHVFARPCAQCRKSNSVRVVTTWDVPWDPDMEEELEVEGWAVARCASCDQALVFAYCETAPGNGGEWVPAYPRTPAERSHRIPLLVRDALAEAAGCIDAGIPRASVVLARRALEGLCRDQGYRERNLAATLNRMRADGVIDVRMFEWSRLVREVGNEAAHDFESAISEQDARDVLHFTEAMANYIYVDQAHFASVASRRSAACNTDEAGGTVRLLGDSTG